MQPKQDLAVIHTKNHTCHIHSDLTWGRYRNYPLISKEIKAERDFQIKAVPGSIIATNYKSIEDAFNLLGADFNSKPEFDLKSLRAWADYIIG